VNNHTILEILVQHIRKLENINPKSEQLRKFLERFDGINNYDDLMKNLEARKAERMALKNLRSVSFMVAGHS
jgi:hypothetical protein